MAFQIEHFNCEPGDTILVHYTKETDIDSMNQIHEYLTKIFPENKIVDINDYFVDKLTILHHNPKESDKYLWE